MGYVRRGARGEIIGWAAFPNEVFTEQIADDDPEFLAFTNPVPKFEPELDMGGTIAEVIGA